MPIRERAGKWHYRFVVDGREYSGSTGLAAVQKNESKAIAKEESAKRLIVEGKAHLVKIKVQPFSDALDQFLAWAKGEHADTPATWQDARSKTAAAREYFGLQPVHTITAGQLEDFKTWRRHGDDEREIAPVAEVTIRHNLHQLSKFFRYAIKHGWTRVNPVEDVEIPSDADAVRMHVLTPQEEAAYFTAAAEVSEVLHDTSRIMILQGVRPMEALSIQKDDVDLLANRLRVRGRETATGKRRTKTSAGTRVLPMTAETAAICAKWLMREPQSRWLFPSDRVRGQSVSRTNNQHAAALKKCKLQFVPYDLRHTFATRAAAAGVPLMTLAKLLGHANLKTIHRYVHPQDDHLADAMRMVESSSPSGFCPVAAGQNTQKPTMHYNMHEKEDSRTVLKTKDLQ